MKTGSGSTSWSFGGGFTLALTLLGLPYLAILSHILGTSFRFIKQSRKDVKWLFVNYLFYVLTECIGYTVFRAATGEYFISLEYLSWHTILGALVTCASYIATNQFFYALVIASNSEIAFKSVFFKISLDKILPALFDGSILFLVVSILSYSPFLLPVIMAPVFIMSNVVKHATERENASLHDVLTSLPNRGLLNSVLSDISNSKRINSHYAIMLIDLDRFKEINDTLGHQTGDRLLCEAASRMKAAATSQDLVCRLGGDEFAILSLLTAEDYIKEAQVKASEVLDKLNRVHIERGQKILIQGSLGFSLYPDHGKDIESLLTRADIALYTSKKLRGTWCMYDPTVDQENRLFPAIPPETLLLFERGEISCNYQIQLNSATKKPIAVELVPFWKESNELMHLSSKNLHLSQTSTYSANL